MYFDSCYIAKFYLSEPDSLPVRALARTAERVCSSSWALAEVHSVFHRNVREGKLPGNLAAVMASHFSAAVKSGVWSLQPVTDGLLQRVANRLVVAPPTLFLRAGDSVHLATAAELGETEIWTSDRHMLAAAGYFGLIGRSV